MRRALWLGVGVWAGVWISTAGAARLVHAVSEAVRRLREERDEARAEREELRRGLNLYRRYTGPHRGRDAMSDEDTDFRRVQGWERNTA